MQDYVNIGSVPYAEDCVSVGEENYAPRARKECQRFLILIRKKLGNEPMGASLQVKLFPHDFGSYFEVVCHYDTDSEEATNYAYRCEAKAPEYWDE